MIKNKLRLEAKGLIGSEDHDTSAHEMLRSIQKLFAADKVISREKREVPLKEALGRVVAEEIRAQYDLPMFAESLRDGFALACSEPQQKTGQNRFVLVGESGAGDPLGIRLETTETWKVMTGGEVPVNGTRVVPQEWCSVQGNIISIDSCRFAGPAYIKRKGSELLQGSLIIGVGEVVSPASLVKIAEAGCATLRVFCPPRVCFCCTGKELVEAGTVPGAAQKISSNQHLLTALIEQCGCEGYDHGIVGDEKSLVGNFFNASLQGDFDLVITTGGTGGGAFDLVERGFVDAGGTLICTSVALRPGKSLLVGRKGDTIYIGLPGPPRAVHTVFMEIVAPLLAAMRGVKDAELLCILAVVQEDIALKTRGCLVVKEGVLFFENGCCKVRMLTKNETSSCNILIAPGRDQIHAGEKVEVHLRQPLGQISCLGSHL